MAFSMLKTADTLETFLDLLLHEGILTYNPKASAAIELQQRVKHFDLIHKKGAVFAVRQKNDFGQKVKGFIVTSKETLLQQANRISHFTPNIYRRYCYANEKRTHIKGFEEKNLQQINISYYPLSLSLAFFEQVCPVTIVMADFLLEEYFLL